MNALIGVPSPKGKATAGIIDYEHLHPWRSGAVDDDKSMVGGESEGNAIRFGAVVTAVFAALLCFVLFCGTEASAAGIESEIHKSYELTLVAIEQAKKKLEAGKQAGDEIARIKALAAGIASSHSALDEEFRAKEEVIGSHGAKALDRHRAMTDSYWNTFNKYSSTLDTLNTRSSVSAQLTVIKKLKALLDKTIHRTRRPILGALPYRDLNYPARKPDASASVKPAYQGGNQTVGPNDLKSAEEAPVDKEIASLARSLNWNPVAIYEYVKNNIETEWYWGSMKGAEETLRQKSGNDCDQATLLVALLRASGFPSRYVRGTIEFFQDINKVKNLTGINDESKIAEHFRKAGIPFKAVISGGRIVNYQVEHIWVESQIPYDNYRGAVVDSNGKAWLVLDTSIKVNDYQYGSPVDILSEYPLTDIRNQYLAGSGTSTPLEFIRQKIGAYLGGKSQTLSYNDLIATRTLPAEAMNILPASLQFVQKAVTAEYTELPDALKHKIRFTASKNNAPLFSTAINLQYLSNRKIALSYEPETIEDQDLINSWGGLGNTPPYLIRLRPVLKVDGERIIVGSDGLPVGTDYDLTLEVITPNGTEKITSVQITGNLSAIGIAAQKTVAFAQMPEDEKNGEELLFESAINYIDRWNKGENELSSLMRLVITRPTASVVMVGGVIEVDYLLDTPHGYEWRGLFLDANLKSVSSQPADAVNDNRQIQFMQLSALEGSVQEGRIFEDAFKVDSVSTARVIQTANQEAVSVLTINKSNLAQVLPGLAFEDYIKKDITDAVNQNQTVIVPGAEIAYQDWQGIGYIKENPSTGEAGYMLSGMIAGGMTAWSIDKWPGDYSQRLSDPDWEPPTKDQSAEMYIQKIPMTDLQKGKVGSKLDLPLQVVVTNKGRVKLTGVPVQFTIKAGGGKFSNGSSAITVMTNGSGIASAELVLGEKTAANPAHVMEPGAVYSTKVGENIITASLASGVSTVSPFTAYGYPDVADHLRKTYGDDEYGVILSYAGFVEVTVQDKFDNPISNAEVQFTAQQAISEKPCTDCRQAKLIKPSDPCINSVPTLGDCQTESSSIKQFSRSTGASAPYILGGIPDAIYPIEARLDGKSVTFNVRSFPEVRDLRLVATYLYPVDEFGNNITAFKANSDVPVQAKIYMLSNVGDNAYNRITNFDSASVTFAGQPGTASGLNDGIFDGRYILGAGYQEVMIEAEATITKDGQSKTERSSNVMPVYGVDLKPAPIPVLTVDPNGYVTKDTLIRYTIDPPEYKAANAQVVIFKDGTPIAAIPSERQGSGSVTIPQGFNLEIGSNYEAQVSLNWGSSAQILGKKVRMVYVVQRDEASCALNRSFHLSEYDVNTPAGPEYTDSFKVIQFNVPAAAKVSVKLYDEDGTEKETIVQESALAPGDYSFVVDYGTVRKALMDMTSSYFYLLLTMDGQGGSFSKKETIHHGKLSERSDGRMLGQVMVHDVLIQDGSLNLSRQDIALKGRGPQFVFTRSYSNQASPSNEFQPLGQGWRHSMDLKLRGLSTKKSSNGTLPDWVVLRKGIFFNAGDIPPDEGWTLVQCNGTVFKRINDTWFPDRGNHGTLDEAPDAFTYTSKDGTRYRYPKLSWKAMPVESIEDRNRNAMRFAYDPQGRLLTVTDAVGRAFTFTYEKPNGFYNERLTRISGPDDLVLTFTYNENGYLESARRGTKVETYEYLPEKYAVIPDYNLVKATDTLGNSFGYEYYKINELHPNLAHFVKALKLEDVVKKVKYPDGNIALFTYNVETANQRTVTDLNGRDTLYTLNYHGNPLEIDAPEGKKTFMTWSIDEGKDDNVTTSKTDARGNLTRYEYDPKGNITRETDPYGNSIITTWNQKFNVPETRTDRNEVFTEWSYDTSGNLQWQKDGDGKTTSYTYFATGEKKTMTDPRGNQTSYEYDQWGNPSLVTEPGNAITAFAYDIRGRKRSVTDQNGNRTDYTYDALDNPRQIIYPQITGYKLPDGSGNIQDYVYDPQGNLLNETNRNGLKLTYTYTERNQVKTLTRSTGGTKSYSYDGNGNLLTETDWKGAAITHAYNGLNQRTSTANRLGNTRYIAYDLDGNLTSETDFEGRTTDYQYDALNRQTDIFQPALPGQERGHVQNSYFKEADPKKNLHTTTDQEGNTAFFEYNGRYLRARQTDALGGVFQWDYDDSGNLTLETDQEGNSTRHEYDARNRREKTTRMGGVITQFRYDPRGNRIGLTDPRQNTTKTDYDEWNRPYRVTDPDGFVTVTEYDGEANKVKVTDANGGVRVSVRDAQGRVIYAVNAEGATTGYGYDVNDNVVSTEEPNGTITVTQYDAEDKPGLSTETALDGTKRTKGVLLRDKAGNPLQVRDYLGNVVVTEYNALNLPQTVYDPAPFHTQHTDTSYFKTGKVRSVTNRRGFATSHQYDALNREIKITDPLGQAIETTYDKVGNVKTIKDKRGIIKENFFDKLYRLERVEKDGVRLVTNEYDANGNLTATVDANNNRTENTYAKRNLLETTKFPATAAYPDGVTQSRAYDGMKNLLTLTDEEGKVTTHTYDHENRETSTELAGEKTQKTYDISGNLISVTKPMGNVRAMSYDGFKRLVSVVEDPDGPNPAIPGLNLTTRYFYDLNGNLLNRVDALGNRTSYSYDNLNRKTSETRWKNTGNLVTRFSRYDEEGSLLETVDPKGQVFTFDYDELNRQTNAYFPATSTAFNTITRIQKEYDPNSNVTSVTEYKTSLDNLSITDVTTNHYDNFDRLIDSTQRGLTVNYGYDNNGNRTSVATPAGSTAYTFDAGNRIDTASADGLTTSYTYYPDGKKNTVAYPNGTSVSYTYCLTNRVRAVTNKTGETVLSYYNYAYDKNGNRIWRTELQNGAAETSTYAFDRVDRLLSFTIKGASDTKITEYTYEGYNRKTEKLTLNGTVIKSQTYSYDETDWLKRVEDGAKTITYEYDENGNTIRKSDTSLPNQDIIYSYDSKNQLMETKRGLPGSETLLGRYDYNAQGLRIRHRYSERGDVDYFHDGRSVIEEHKAGDNTLLAHYRYADRLVSLDTGSGKQYYHYDALGSTVNLTDDSGLTPVSYQLDPWGHIRNQFGVTVNRHIFTGKEHDENTGLIYFGARYYDPDTGRFITQDAYLGEQSTPPSLHRYLYAYSNPMIYIDLYGYGVMDFLEQVYEGTKKGFSGAGEGLWREKGNIAQGVHAGVHGVNTLPDKIADQVHTETTSGAIAVTGAYTVSKAVLGASTSMLNVGDQSITFAENPGVTTIPIVAPISQNAGESVARAVEEGGAVNYIQAGGNILLGVASALGVTGLARSAGVPGTYGNRTFFQSKTAKAANEISKAEIQQTVTTENSGGLSEIEARPVEAATIEKPTTPYSTTWDAWYKQNPYSPEAQFRSLGAAGNNEIGVAAKRGAETAESGVHKNSLDYIGDTHVYRIKGPDDTTYRIGESARGTRLRDDASIRAEQQARRLTRETGERYETEIRKYFPDKASARDYETRLIERFRRMYGEDTLPGNKTNR